MINIKLFVSVCLIACCSFTHADDIIIKEPAEIGRDVCYILENLDKAVKERYVKCYISIAELRELHLTADESTREDIEGISDTEWADMKGREYTEIKKQGVLEEIKWGNIEYSGFEYEVVSENGVVLCIGTLFFTDRTKFIRRVYSVEVISIYDGKGYRLVEIGKLTREG